MLGQRRKLVSGFAGVLSGTWTLLDVWTEVAAASPLAGGLIIIIILLGPLLTQ
jgi:hypothetical protein